ncbi:MAG: MerR family transcriptional regulator [Armatimonadota bacterium]|nr:MerR family transcriptional regulator [Armatimonadota bacterium]
MKHHSDDPVYVISVAAKLVGLPCWMLRQLDNEGLVSPTRTAKNRRLYSDRDIATLEYIRFLTTEKRVNVAGIRYIFELEGRFDQMAREGGGKMNR